MNPDEVAELHQAMLNKMRATAKDLRDKGITSSREPKKSSKLSWFAAGVACTAVVGVGGFLVGKYVLKA